MAIYHLEAKVISRGAGRSAVAVAAYMSCSEIYNDYDGVQHDYTHKQGLVWHQTFLSEYAPQEWQDRAVLWNAVEAAEKAKDSRLAREFVVALPVELDREQQQTLLTEYIGAQFVADGMCADAAIHDTDGHNPHAHILLTVRPLNEDGTWQHKTEKEYLCVRGGEERGFTAAELKAAQSNGWEKQYQYQAGKKKVYLAPSTAEAQGYERLNKYPKSTKFGRQNPISERWNSEEQLRIWREAWAETSNLFLERIGTQARIDHRSHAVLGMAKQPTVHEGVIAQALEHKGIISDRCETNRQIRADNKLLRELKAQVQKLMQAVEDTIPPIAVALERLRGNMLIFKYQVIHAQISKKDISQSLDRVVPAFNRYATIIQRIKSMTQERKTLLTEKKNTSVLQILKHRDLSRRIAELSEDIEELRSEKARILLSLDKTEDAGMVKVREWINSMESSLERLEQSEQKYYGELDTALAEFKELTLQSAEMDISALNAARQVFRPDIEIDAMQKLQDVYNDKYQPEHMNRSKRDIATLLGDEQAKLSIQKQLYKLRQEQSQRDRQQISNRKPKYQGEER